MAITTVNLSDPVSTWVTKTNTIATQLGDLALVTIGGSDLVTAANRLDSNIGTMSTLTTTDKSDLVSAINEINVAASAALIRSKFQPGQGINYDSASGLFSAELANADSAASGLRNAGIVTPSEVFFTTTGDSAFMTIADSAVSSTELRNAVRLRIYNSVGGTLKDLYGAGT